MYVILKKQSKCMLIYQFFLNIKKFLLQFSNKIKKTVFDDVKKKQNKTIKSRLFCITHHFLKVLFIL